MNVELTCKCLQVVDSFLDGQHLSVFERLEMLKYLQYAVLIDLQDDEELPPVVLRNFKNISKEKARFIVLIRNSDPVNTLSFLQERFIYRELLKIYKIL